MIKNLYCNGSSLSAGGGLYENSIKEEYKKLYNISWVNEKDVTYAKYVADNYKWNLIHDAECGSGVPRLVRRTYEYIQKIGIESAKQTLFLFEITDPVHRVDMFCKEIDDYVIVNVRYDDFDSVGNLTDLSVVYSYSPTNRPYPNEFFSNEIKNNIENYLEKFHNPVVYSNKFIGELVGLFSFLDRMDINFFYMFDNDYLRNYETFESFYKEMDKKHKIYIDNDCFSSNHFCIKNKLTIKDELNNFSGDTHPGYFGYKKFSEIIIKNIDERLFI